jgi:ethanolamine permease
VYAIYIMSLLSLVRLRRREPELERPFRAPLYPFFPLTALTIAAVSLIAIVYYNPFVAGLFAILGVAGGAVTSLRAGQGTRADADPMLRRPASS